MDAFNSLIKKERVGYDAVIKALGDTTELVARQKNGAARLGLLLRIPTGTLKKMHMRQLLALLPTTIREPSG
ncbi:hypothetical protein [Caproiciproducens faecalis]|uniref:Uncharacterized protein n=1 Tax=Caproiciproducens faecalis TaxID=2820301 RepID=A0ABS7DK81_9FIRM|nr:hypothetical protein [Caproiciproducens faecalis]MBW7571628.1 hypothetical protein [Caproiciproducens faecalis]